MSTEVSSVYDALVTRITTLLPSASGYRRLEDPYEISKNSDTTLQQGWGVLIGPGTEGPGELGNKLAVSRDFAVLVSRSLKSLAQNPTTKATAEKLLMEDMVTVAGDIHKKFTLESSQRVANYTGDSGIQYVSVSQKNFIWIRIDFMIRTWTTIS